MTTDSIENNDATGVEELFAKVASVEETLNNPSPDVDGLGESLHLYGICMGIVAESTTVALTDEQRAEFNMRMNSIDDKVQEQAMKGFLE